MWTFRDFQTSFASSAKAKDANAPKGRGFVPGSGISHKENTMSTSGKKTARDIEVIAR